MTFDIQTLISEAAFNQGKVKIMAPKCDTPVRKMVFSFM